jgi:hypothetical protein
MNGDAHPDDLEEPIPLDELMSALAAGSDETHGNNGSSGPWPYLARPGWAPHGPAGRRPAGRTDSRRPKG